MPGLLLPLQGEKCFKKKKMQLYSAFLMRKLRLSGCRGDGKASTSLANPLNSLDQRLKCI